MASEKATVVMSESVEKNEVETTQHLENLHVVKKIHADGHVDLVDAHAIGGAAEDMPPGYFWSISFIGTVTVRSLPSLPPPIHVPQHPCEKPSCMKTTSSEP